MRHASALQGAVRQAVTPKDLTRVLHTLRDLALTGDVSAAKVLLERCLGRATEEPRPFNVALPDLTTAEGVADAMRAIVGAVASGDLTTADASAVVGLLRAVADATVFAELDARVSELEFDKLNR